MEFGLIEDVKLVDPKAKIVCGYYIKMNYIFFKQETLGKSQCTRNQALGNKCTNALSENNTYPSSVQKPIEEVSLKNKKSDQSKKMVKRKN